MGDGQLSDRELDSILALQFLVAWAGEGLCQPKRLDWWRTDLIDGDGGGYFLQALLPKTHQWAAFEAVRKAALQHDHQTRLNMAYPDSIRTLFFWGFHIDEQLDDRLAQHKRSDDQVLPEKSLSLPINLNGKFAKADFEIAVQNSHRSVQYKVVPEGREIVEAIPASKELCARNLAATLLPLADHYPMPFYRLGGL